LTLDLHFTSTEASLRPIGELDLAIVSEFRAALLILPGRWRYVVPLDHSDPSFVDAAG
jgi:hypothetical protein